MFFGLFVFIFHFFFFLLNQQFVCFVFGFFLATCFLITAESFVSGVYFASVTLTSISS
jgi:hypothetical protein